jgi:hypothetical protein
MSLSKSGQLVGIGVTFSAIKGILSLLSSSWKMGGCKCGNERRRAEVRLELGSSWAVT